MTASADASVKYTLTAKQKLNSPRSAPLFIGLVSPCQETVTDIHSRIYFMRLTQYLKKVYMVS